MSRATRRLRRRGIEAAWTLVTAIALLFAGLAWLLWHLKERTR